MAINSWTEAEDQILRHGVGEGLSASKIAAQIPGKTRNSIIGRAGRLGLRLNGADKAEARKRMAGGRAGALPAAIEARKLQASKAKAEARALAGAKATIAALSPPARPSPPMPRAVPGDAPAPIGEIVVLPKNISLYFLEPGACRWPYDVREGFVFCGHKQAVGSSYCHHHFLKSLQYGAGAEQGRRVPTAEAAE